MTIDDVVSTLAVELQQVRVGEVTVLSRLTGDEIFFAGHYPAMPILPGVLVIHLADLAMRHYAGARLPRAVRLVEVASVKFLAPVLPPSEVELTCVVTHEDDRRLKVTARARVGDNDVARMRLRYAMTIDD